MNRAIPISVDGQAGILVTTRNRVLELRAKARERLVVMDANMRTLAAKPEEGAATAEYAMVLVAATGFAAILIAMLKSDTVRTLVLNIVKKALNIG